MVLRTLALVVFLFGCKQSLFDSHGDDDSKDASGDGGPLAETCPAPCVGDAGGDFNGSAMGTDGNWRYVEDSKARTWTAMTPSGSTFVGATTGNSITNCKSNNADVCSQLPGAILMSTAGTGPVSAVEWVAPTSRAVQLQLGIRIPDGGATQTIKLYRSSREDALYTAVADPGVTISNTLAVDVLQGDRIYVTLDGAAVTNAGVQLFIVGTTATFPSTCQIALEFSAATGNTIDNLCGADFTYMNYDASDTPIAPTLATGPFAEEGMGATIATGKYYDAPNPIDHSGDFTIQYWVKFNGVVDSDTGGWMYSDDDLDATGGIGMVLYTDQMTNHVAIDVTSCTDATNLTFDDIFAQYPAGTDWHFIRVVHAGTDVALCVDGTKLGSKTFTKASLATTYPPYLGKDVKWLPTEPSFNGALDDVRVIAQALPCN